MENKHLSDSQIARSAESLIINESVNFSNSVKKHLDQCMTCSVQVQVKLDSLNAKYKDRISNNLSRNKKAPNQISIWLGVSVSILFMIVIGIAFLKH